MTPKEEREEWLDAFNNAYYENSYPVPQTFDQLQESLQVAETVADFAVACLNARFAKIPVLR